MLYLATIRWIRECSLSFSGCRRSGYKIWSFGRCWIRGWKLFRQHLFPDILWKSWCFWWWWDKKKKKKKKAEEHDGLVVPPRTWHDEYFKKCTEDPLFSSFKLLQHNFLDHCFWQQTQLSIVWRLPTLFVWVKMSQWQTGLIYNNPKLCANLCFCPDNETQE